MSPRTVQEPTVTHDEGPGRGDHATTTTHPAFGQVACGRISGQAYLYGSDFSHQHFMYIEIRRSQLHRDISHDWHFPREELIKVYLSEAQWAAFVSSPNHGSGVPCTISWLTGQGDIPELPAPRKPQDLYMLDVDNKIRAAAERIDQAIGIVEAELAGLSQKKRETVVKTLEALRRDIGANLPYVRKSFGEHMEGLVEKAKTEAHAYATALITRLGLRTAAALEAGGAIDEPVSLPASTEPGEHEQ